MGKKAIHKSLGRKTCSGHKAWYMLIIELDLDNCTVIKCWLLTVFSWLMG